MTDTIVFKMIWDVIDREGGYVDHPRDRGGPTKYGITIDTLSAYLGRRATIVEVQELGQQKAGEIYEREYFYKPRIYRLPLRLHEFVFDSAVQHGQKQAVIFAQKVCNFILSDKEELGVDGIIGPKTEAAANTAFAVLGDRMVHALFKMRREFYVNIVKNNESQRVFFPGWLNRLKKLEEKYFDEE